MQNKTITILISLMLCALIGITAIQYNWINKTITEKQALIDNTVYQSIRNIDHKLNTYKSMAFMTDSIFKKIDINTQNGVTNVNVNVNSESSTEVKVVSSYTSETDIDFDSLCIKEFYYNSNNSPIDSITFIQINNEYKKATDIFNQIKVELKSTTEDSRLDSVKIASLLKTEFTTNKVGQLKNWSIYDLKNNKFVINPNENTSNDYQINLFPTDIISPNRYEFRLNMNSKQSINSDIMTMIILSSLFLLIMFLVFLFSIRLAIKHKKISAIKTDFINNMTHEFKTPLASISLASETILHPSTINKTDVIQKYIGIIQEEKTKLNQHIERILEVASLNKNNLDLSLETISLNDIITTSIHKLDLLIDKNNITLEFENIQQFNVLANAYHLENVLTNIIENSIKYKSKEPTIHIKIAKENQNISVTISDNGIGMTKTQLNKAFEVFYRAETGNIHNTKGFGLGLSYCKLIIEKMNGTISISSKTNKGTTVQLNLKQK